jgi:adenylylsulfate kinase
MTAKRQHRPDELSDGAVVWVTGLSSAGKSTIAGELVRQLRRDGHAPVLLDGDEIRDALDMTGHYDTESRLKAAFTYARLCNLLARKGHTVVIATISLFREVHHWNRQHLPRYFEVVLNVPRSELQRRDKKGLYREGAQNTVGAGQKAEFPSHPEMVIDNYGDTDPQSAAAEIRRHGEAKGLW